MAKDITSNPIFRIVAVIAIIIIIIGFATNWTFGLKKKGAKEGDDCMTKADPSNPSVSGKIDASGNCVPIGREPVGERQRCPECQVTASGEYTGFTKGGLYSTRCCPPGGSSARMRQIPDYIEDIRSGQLILNTQNLNAALLNSNLSAELANAGWFECNCDDGTARLCKEATNPAGCGQCCGRGIKK